MFHPRRVGVRLVQASNRRRVAVAVVGAKPPFRKGLGTECTKVMKIEGSSCLTLTDRNLVSSPTRFCRKVENGLGNQPSEPQ